ncbi:MAG: hypothetical protein IJ867_02285 [Clostridia bacterium]|nr:hypothetical protein [Clostridia bacterium]
MVYKSTTYKPFFIELQRLKMHMFREKVYQKILPNGLSVIAIPNDDMEECYLAWNVGCGSVDNTFHNSK